MEMAINWTLEDGDRFFFPNVLIGRTLATFLQGLKTVIRRRNVTPRSQETPGLTRQPPNTGRDNQLGWRRHLRVNGTFHLQQDGKTRVNGDFPF